MTNQDALTSTLFETLAKINFSQQYYANAVENALGQALPVAIGFLASLLGLGDLSQKIRKVIDKVQEPINTAIDYVLNLVKRFVQKVAKMLGFGSEAGTSGDEDEIGEVHTLRMVGYAVRTRCAILISRRSRPCAGFVVQLFRGFRGPTLARVSWSPLS